MSKEPQPEPKKSSEIKWYALIFVVVMFVLSFSSYLSAQQDIAQKQYLSSLTPQERADLAKQQALEKQQADERSRQWWENFWKTLAAPIIPPIAIPFIFAMGWIAMNFVTRRASW